MRFALDKKGKRICSTDPVRYEECFCIACGEKLKHKKGEKNQPYFAHMPDTTCSYGKDKDNKSEWHIRMQNYFPNEFQEIRFVDEETGEVHIADVFDTESNTVLEFQKSPISREEFFKRTSFHIRKGRRIVWLFDESSENNKYFGKLKPDDLYAISKLPYRDIYKDKNYRRLRKPRSTMLNSISNIQGLDDTNFVIYVFSGTEGDIFHRIIKQEYEFEYVILSVHDVVMKTEMDFNEFFTSENKWLQEEPYKSVIDNYNVIQAYQNLVYKQQQAELSRMVFNSLIRRKGRSRRL